MGPLDIVLDLLDLEPIEVNIFRGRQPPPVPGLDRSRVFGGQVASQALVAAARTVEHHTVHSIHCYFLRPGDPAVPILYDVDRIRDGRSFTTRRVVAIQHGRAIFNMQASFHADEPGDEHHEPMPDVVPPESLPTRSDLHAAGVTPPDWPDIEGPLDFRYVTDPPYRFEPGRPARQLVWVRTTAAIPDDPRLHTCLLTYLSDMYLLDTCTMPHFSGYGGAAMMASLDHVVWFHRPCRVDEWLLYVMDSPSASGARGINRGLLYRRDGTLVASVAQEGLMRRVRSG